MPHNTKATQSNIADKQHTKHSYEKPENVNYSQPFQFIVKNSDGLVHTVEHFHEGQVRVEWESGNSSTTYEHTSIRRFINRGAWLVLKQPPEPAQEDLFGTTFQFTCSDEKPVYTYSKYHGGNPLITWETTRGLGSTTLYSEKTARALVAGGTWTIIPSECPSQTAPENVLNVQDVQTDGESSKAAFGALETIIRASYNAPEKGLLDVIKHACISTNGRIAVTVYPEHYEIYHRVFFEDCVKVVERNLADFLKALLIVDKSDNWGE